MPQSHPLTPREIAALAFIVVIWGANNAAAEVATDVLPPLLVGALRFSMAAVFLAPFVRPPFPNPISLLVLVVCGGPLHFGLVYYGFSLTEDLSPYAVSLQLWIPFTALFAWLLLGERLPKAALLGLVIAFAGVVFMTADPRALRDWDAIAIGVVASACWALATVVARRTAGVPPLKLQGMLSLVAAPTLFVGAFLFEGNVPAALGRATPAVWAAIAFGALISTVIATGLLFWLVQRREAGRVTPYLLSTPIVSIAIGVAFLGDVLTAQIVIGACATIGGVAVVALAERGLRAGASRS
jgi:O-acetylserine/cysteine efflux transporter